MDLILKETIMLIIDIVIFFALMVIFKYVYSKLKNNHSRILNPAEYFPRRGTPFAETDILPNHDGILLCNHFIYADFY